MMMTTFDDFTILVILLLLCCAIYTKRCRQRLPPGPSGGIFGLNRAQLSQNEPWKKFASWSEEYGPVISFYFGKTPIIVLNTLKSASETLDKRGDIYSSRPRSVSGQEILSANLRGLPAPYGDRWRRWRKTLHLAMEGKAALPYRQFQTLESSILLRDILMRPEEFLDHFVRYQISVVFSMSYGSRIKTTDEWIVHENRRAGIAFLKTQIPGRYIVDTWPILLWLPKALQWFRYDLERSQALDQDLYVTLLQGVQKRMHEGRAKESMCKRMLSSVTEEGMDIIEQAYAASAPFAAGVETVTSTMSVFILAMLHYPNCALKAQAELASVVGQARLPTFDDQPALPYVTALMKEVLRWRPAAPIGVPHATTHDDVYEGFYIPKGSTVYANIGAMCLDAALFPDPDRFMPERFMDPKDQHLADFTLPFGFGRRICAGIDVAQQSLFIVISRILWAYDILPMLDDTGKASLPATDAFIGGFIRRPLPFRAHFVPRSEDARKMILQDAADADDELVAWE